MGLGDRDDVVEIDGADSFHSVPLRQEDFRGYTADCLRGFLFGKTKLPQRLQRISRNLHIPASSLLQVTFAFRAGENPPPSLI